MSDTRSMAFVFDPGAQSGDAVPAAVRWIEGVLLGSVGTSLAAIAVAWVAFEMLTGRLSPRRGGTVVLGCFILFGAPELARMLSDAIRGAGVAGRPVVVQPISGPPLPAPKPPPPYDPYAGASVPKSGN